MLRSNEGLLPDSEPGEPAAEGFCDLPKLTGLRPPKVIGLTFPSLFEPELSKGDSRSDAGPWRRLDSGRLFELPTCKEIHSRGRKTAREEVQEPYGDARSMSQNPEGKDSKQNFHRRICKETTASEAISFSSHFLSK